MVIVVGMLAIDSSGVDGVGQLRHLLLFIQQPLVEDSHLLPRLFLLHKFNAIKNNKQS